ncbi:MAG: NUDIX domain-containing protein [Acinetobacter populi]|jgi:8-oxo-dGTP pyrophosphatase MutT (NUDIX family)|uniref:NUDIX hydrolase n=1 Tax=Acinetobacter populi TaxID=1582270 RepID=UPI00235691E8|nr:NUDIX domain-containing protein [Acinetobacter populi]MCH4246311.1 NUDIX domain-containing protein [Acinetobacter populi]
MQTIRAKDLCIFRHNNKVLLSEAYDPAKDEHYLRPIGGSIEFGETSQQAIEREVLEEIGTEIHVLGLLEVYENLFTFNGKQGHEIVFMYHAQLKDQSIYDQPQVLGCETDGTQFIAKWFSQAEIYAPQKPVYPIGVDRVLFSNAF